MTVGVSIRPSSTCANFNTLSTVLRQTRGSDERATRFAPAIIEAAYYWTKVADQWEDVFLEMRNRSHFIAWEGAGGDGCDSEPALTYR